MTDHQGDAVTAGDVHPAGGANRGGIDIGDPREPQRATQILSCSYVNSAEDSLVVLERIERVSVQQRRWHVRRSAVARPQNLVGSGNFAPGAGQADGQQGPRLVAAAGIHEAVRRYWGSYDVG